MKRELTIKELAAYLPYRFRFTHPAIAGGVGVMIGFGSDRDGCSMYQYCTRDRAEKWERIISDSGIREHMSAEQRERLWGMTGGEKSFVNYNSKMRLVLRPLSQLTEEITHNGEIFWPIPRLVGLFGNGFDYGDMEVDTEKYPYEIVQQLLEWHFDIFGLIPEGLAVAMNPDGTLTQNT